MSGIVIGKPKWDGGRAVFGGAKERLPLTGFPTGRVRLRFRPGSWATAFVKTMDGITHWYLEEVDGAWWPGWKIGENLRIKTGPKHRTPQERGYDVRCSVCGKASKGIWKRIRDKGSIYAPRQHGVNGERYVTCEGSWSEAVLIDDKPEKGD